MRNGDRGGRCVNRSDAHQPVPLHSPLSPQASATLRLTGLFKELSSSHLFLDTAPFNQFPEATNCLLDAFAIANRQFDHEDLLPLSEHV